MPVDPAGTTPGLQPDTPPKQLVNLKCRNTNCDSIEAEIIKIPGQESQRLYRCTKCSHTWGINVGGSVNL